MSSSFQASSWPICCAACIRPRQRHRSFSASLAALCAPRRPTTSSTNGSTATSTGSIRPNRGAHRCNVSCAATSSCSNGRRFIAAALACACARQQDDVFHRHRVRAAGHPLQRRAAANEGRALSSTSFPESINNPLRLIIGWVMIDPTTLPPGSLILMYWSGRRVPHGGEAAFRISRDRRGLRQGIAGALPGELCLLLGNRRSRVSCFVYALLAVFFLAVFLIKYRIEYLLTVPVVIALFAYYMIMAMTPGLGRPKAGKAVSGTWLGHVGGLARRNIPAGDVRRRADVRCARRATLHRHPMISDRAAGTFDWAGVRLVAFDVDGTLYSQPRLRLRIAREMLIDAVIRQSLEAVTIVRAYRQIRERMAEREVADYEGTLILETARAARQLPERVRGIVDEWIERRPLRHLEACRYPGVFELFAGLRRNGKVIGIFSDYPAQAKLDALGLRADISSLRLTAALAFSSQIRADWRS